MNRSGTGWNAYLKYYLPVGNRNAPVEVHAISLGTIEMGTNRTFSKSVQCIPLLSLKSQNAFPIESGSEMSYNLKIKRTNPTDSDNDCDTYVAPRPGENIPSEETILDHCIKTDKWSNAHWWEQLVTFVDRWQAKSDGVILTMIPSDGGGHGEDSTPYLPLIDMNNHGHGYIRDLTLKSTSDFASLVDVDLQLDVGTMYVNAGVNPDEGIKMSDVRIYLSDTTGTYWFPICKNYGTNSAMNIVTDVTYTAGLTQPFPSATITLNRKKLVRAYRMFGKDNAIVAGKNQVMIKGLDSMIGTVVSVPSRGMRSEMMTISVYDNAEKVRGHILDTPVSDTPIKLIPALVAYGTDEQYSTGDVKIRSYSIGDNSKIYDKENMLTFPKGTNVWTALQVCATYIHCKIFFHDGICEVADCTDITTFGDNSYADIESAIITQSDKSLAGAPEAGAEGSGTLMKSCQVKGNLLGKESITDDELIEKLSVMDYSRGEVDDSDAAEAYDFSKFLKVSNMSVGVPTTPEEVYQDPSSHPGVYIQPYHMAKGLVDYRYKTQTPLSFTVKEFWFDIR